MTSMRNFIKENRKEIDATIKEKCPNCCCFNDEEREMWVQNDEGLYKWFMKEKRKR